MIDGKDILDRLDDGMGLDPSEFFEQSALLKGGRVLIGRCSCGTIGCSDFATDVTIGEAFLEWRGDGGIFVFPTSTYSGLIVGAANDHSWENVNRRTERLVSQALAGVTLENGKAFQWASARIEPGQVKLSFGDASGQSLFSIGWDGMGWILQLRSPRPNHFGWTAVVENGAVLIRDENQFSARLSTGRPPIALA